MPDAALVSLIAIFIGIVAGLRAMTAPAAVSWAAALGWLDLSGTALAFLGYRWTPWILTLFALGEFVTDQLPSTPSRKVPIQFGTRVISGALSGGAVGAPSNQLVLGAVLGAIGAVIGTLGGSAIRSRLAAAFKKDPPAALIEDAVAVGAAVMLMVVLR